MPAGRIPRVPSACERLGHHFTTDNRFSTEPCVYCKYQRAYDGSEAALDASLKSKLKGDVLYHAFQLTFIALVVFTCIAPWAAANGWLS